jgi:hypothetical protein
MVGVSKIWKIENAEKRSWVCDCGNVKQIKVSHVASGLTKSCCNCRSSIYGWFVQHQIQLSQLHRIDAAHQMPAGGIVALEQVQNSVTPFRAVCPACGNEYRPRLSDIKRGLSLTCGCVAYTKSSGATSIAKYIESFGFEVIQEFELCGKKFDVCVPERKLLLEYNGLRWHSLPGSKQRDFCKYRIALDNRYEFMSVFEDEWVKSNHIVINLIKSRLGMLHPQSIRPKNCEFHAITFAEADDFYERFHYLGMCRAKINYGAFCKNQLIACVSFKRPTRQSKFDWELVRMVSNPEFRVHGVWSKLLRVFADEHQPQSIVSFSDNRLFTGGTYTKLGFKLDGETRPSYYWMKNNKRFHKSKMRKPAGCTMTESELRHLEGYSKIWDLGKKRWVWMGN